MLHWFLLGIVLADNSALDVSSHVTETYSPKPTTSSTEVPTAQPTASPTEMPTPTYASKSGVPSVLAVVLSCVVGLVIVLASTTVLCIMKSPENEEGWGSTQPLIIKQDF